MGLGPITTNRRGARLRHYDRRKQCRAARVIMGCSSVGCCKQGRRARRQSRFDCLKVYQVRSCRKQFRRGPSPRRGFFGSVRGRDSIPLLSLSGGAGRAVRVGVGAGVTRSGRDMGRHTGVNLCVSMGGQLVPLPGGLCGGGGRRRRYGAARRGGAGAGQAAGPGWPGAPARSVNGQARKVGVTAPIAGGGPGWVYDRRKKVGRGARLPCCGRYAVIAYRSPLSVVVRVSPGLIAGGPIAISPSANLRATTSAAVPCGEQSP